MRSDIPYIQKSKILWDFQIWKLSRVETKKHPRMDREEKALMKIGAFCDS
nr:MAG TPA: hypothetical protein [Caudoviricetes sp.]